MDRRLQQCSCKHLRKHWAQSIAEVPELAAVDEQLDFPGLLAAVAVPLQRRLFGAVCGGEHGTASVATSTPARQRKSARRSGVKAQRDLDSPVTDDTAVPGSERLIAAISTTPVAAQTVLHGDFKAENMCFRDDDGKPHCAVFDFQWAGGGYPAVDIVYLLLTSLDEGVLDAEESSLLDYYHSKLEAYAHSDLATDGGGSTRAALQQQYELAMLDFARFALGDGALIECDLGQAMRWTADGGCGALAMIDAI